MNYSAKFEQGLNYADFLARYGSDEHRRRWGAMHERIKLNDAQRELLKSFKRRMPVMVLAGAWCGDCVDQCPIFEHFAAANENLIVRYFDRDADADLQPEFSICGGARVPSVLFLSEDFQPIGRYGDRTLAKYRAMAAAAGSSCSTGLVGPGSDFLSAVVQEWLDQFERSQLILRTSPRLRQIHRD